MKVVVCENQSKIKKSKSENEYGFQYQHVSVCERKSMVLLEFGAGFNAPGVIRGRALSSCKACASTRVYAYVHVSVSVVCCEYKSKSPPPAAPRGHRVTSTECERWEFSLATLGFARLTTHNGKCTRISTRRRNKHVQKNHLIGQNPLCVSLMRKRLSPLPLFSGDLL